MNKPDCAKVLAKIQLGDSRKVDQLVLDDWFETIRHLDYEDAYRAVVLHRQESTDYLMPAHVIRNAARLREQRALTVGPAMCPAHDGYPMPCDRCRREST